MLYHAPGKLLADSMDRRWEWSLSTATCLVGREPAALLTTLVRLNVFADQPQGRYGH
jgi:hypothetical protein